MTRMSRVDQDMNGLEYIWSQDKALRKGDQQEYDNRVTWAGI
jgi:hypothetical protein